MVQELNIMVACGSGVATSTIAVNAIKEILDEAEIPAKFYKCSLGELESKQSDANLVLTTANYKKPLDVPHMSVFGLISGINSEEVKEKLIQMCRSILSK